MTIGRSLYVCWADPGSVPPGAEVLSFLTPHDEEALRARIGGDRVVSGRALAQAAREQARSAYLTLVANAGATPYEGQTLRQRLTVPGQVSAWWFHGVAGKDCENDDPTLRWIIELHVIERAARDRAATRLILIGGYRELGQVLEQRYQVETRQCPWRYTWRYQAAGFLKRWTYGAAFLMKWLAVRRSAPSTDRQPFDVVLSGFWDWSLKADQSGRLNDRYLGSLAGELSRRGLKVGWLLWFDPYSVPGAARRRLGDVLRPLASRADAVLLQRYLGLTDLVRALCNMRPWRAFREARNSPAFARTFVLQGIDYMPLFSPRLTAGFLDATIPHLELVALAVERAFAVHRPQLALSFLDLFPFARAFYAGGRAGKPDAIQATIQHATYNREEAFALLHPQAEYLGEPDGCRFPAPDYVFAMGELGQAIFRENGFPNDRVLLTGSPRYQHVHIDHRPRERAAGPITVLIAASMGVETELEMAEAVCLAADGLPGIRVVLRNHPFARVDADPRFHRLADRLTVATGSLDDSLAAADLVVITYSSVGEEAILGGIPVWQWLTSSYNGSAFRDISGIPAFHSVSDLRTALVRLLGDPSAFAPSDAIKETVLRECFYKEDGAAVTRIADACDRLLGKAAA